MVMTELAKSAFERAFAEGIAHQNAGRLNEAEAAYRMALAIVPGHAPVTHNLGVIAAARGDHCAALGHFDEATAVQPQYASAHYNRGVALIALDRQRDAIQSLSRACAIEPEHYDAHRALGFLWLAKGERGRALDHFARTYELRRGEDRTGMAARSLTSTRDKLLHDSSNSGSWPDAATTVSASKSWREPTRRWRKIRDETAKLSGEQLDTLGEDYNTAINIRGAPELAGRAVSERSDHDTIMRRFHEQPGVVFFDDLLTPPALQVLKQYLLESTIWHDFDHIDGFVASYLEDGLACPLLLQIADEIRRAFPELLQGRRFRRPGPSRRSTPAAVDAHADDAAVSINFWMTPNEANLDPDRGGLTVCRVPPPAAWQFRTTTRTTGRMYHFATARGRYTDRALSPESGRPLRIPPVPPFGRAGFCNRLREPQDQPDDAVRPS